MFGEGSVGVNGRVCMTELCVGGTGDLGEGEGRRQIMSRAAQKPNTTSRCSNQRTAMDWGALTGQPTFRHIHQPTCRFTSLVLSLSVKPEYANSQTIANYPVIWTPLCSRHAFFKNNYAALSAQYAAPPCPAHPRTHNPHRNRTAPLPGSAASVPPASSTCSGRGSFPSGSPS